MLDCERWTVVLFISETILESQWQMAIGVHWAGTYDCDSCHFVQCLACCRFSIWNFRYVRHFEWSENWWTVVFIEMSKHESVPVLGRVSRCKHLIASRCNEYSNTKWKQMFFVRALIVVNSIAWGRLCDLRMERLGTLDTKYVLHFIQKPWKVILLFFEYWIQSFI